MTDHQAEILAFAVKWAPFDDGGDEHVLSLFGLSLSAYHRRLLILLNSPAAGSIALSTREKLRQRSVEGLRSSAEIQIFC